MSDISIPGVPGSSKYNTDQMIEELMKAERIPLDRMEAEKEAFETKRSAWQGTNRNLTQLREAARALFSFENPFNERIATSSDESVLTASADRTAALENSMLEVKSVAGRDRFASRSLDNDFEVRAGTYRFEVGEQEIGFTFRGGSLESFARTVNERAGEMMRARVIRNTSDTQVFVIESLEEGAANALNFLEDSIEFGVEAGIIKPTDDTFRMIDVGRATVRALTNPINDSHVRFVESGVELLPDSAISVPVAPPVAVKENLVMEFTYSMTKIPYEYTPPTPPPGPSTPAAPGSVEFDGIVIRNESSRVVAPDWNPPPPPEKRDDLTVFSLATGAGEIELQAIPDTEGTRTVRIALDEYAEIVSGLNMRNDNTHRQFTIESVKVFDPTTRGQFVPEQPLETASDAVLAIDGIEVIRESNEIDDLIAGVTLTVKRPSDGPVSVSVAPDTESVKDSIISFVGYYNQLMTDISILTSRSDEVIEEIGYFTDEEREAATEKLGLLQGDITMMQLKSRLQTLMMNAYPTDLGRELALLDQIGISTNPTGGGGSVERSRLRGYLDIDEGKLDAALENRLDAVQQLFGQDTDGDLLVDTGVAVAFDAYTQPYVQTGGFLSTKIGTLGTQIADAEEDIADFEDKLVQIEQEYKEQYGAMEAALRSLEQSSSQLESFSNNNSN